MARSRNVKNPRLWGCVPRSLVEGEGRQNGCVRNQGVCGCVWECTCVEMHCLCVCAHVFRCQSYCDRGIRG